MASLINQVSGFTNPAAVQNADVLKKTGHTANFTCWEQLEIGQKRRLTKCKELALSLVVLYDMLNVESLTSDTFNWTFFLPLLLSDALWVMQCTEMRPEI